MSHDAAEIDRLWKEYQRAIVFALEIIKTNGPNAAAFPKVRAQHEKASRLMEVIRESYGVPKLIRRDTG